MAILFSLYAAETKSGKSQSVRSRYNRKTIEPPRLVSKEAPTQRPKRVFGTTRNPNIQTNPATERSKSKPSLAIPQKQSKPAQPTPPSKEIPVIETANETTEESRVKPKKKSVCFEEKIGKVAAKDFQEGEKAEIRTPVRSPSLAKPRISGTPYLSAERCSKCRFDRLETSSYWLGQIKLAESVGKHFATAAFFRLAFESKAEPFRNLRIELKRYLARHGYLSAEKEWKEVSHSYELVKDESNVAEEGDSSPAKALTSDPTVGIQDQEHDELQEKAAEEFETKSN
ncbi:hypothetical protein RJ640_012431 [Escallonia rubra]|uniref:Uncharacterized protein n=1 Tax=Escallonia rubra TaxID=112253 RepID=A0AA88QGQ1_9ASTE|nr:hypothetical protein RJ640_012431 [Escallonia rubra]